MPPMFALCLSLFFFYYFPFFPIIFFFVLSLFFEKIRKIENKGKTRTKITPQKKTYPIPSSTPAKGLRYQFGPGIMGCFLFYSSFILFLMCVFFCSCVFRLFFFFYVFPFCFLFPLFFCFFFVFFPIFSYCFLFSYLFSFFFKGSLRVCFSQHHK